MIKLFSGDISDITRHSHKVFEHYQHMSSTQVSLLPKERMLEIHSSCQKPQTGLSALARISDRREQTEKLSSLLLQPHCEYLSLILPQIPSERIQVLGKSSLVGQYFELRAGLVLSALRVLSNRLDNSLVGGAPTHFDILLMESTDFLCALKPRSKMRSKPRTSRWLIKALLRLEERRLKSK